MIKRRANKRNARFLASRATFYTFAAAAFQLQRATFGRSGKLRAGRCDAHSPPEAALLRSCATRVAQLSPQKVGAPAKLATSATFGAAAAAFINRLAERSGGGASLAAAADR